MAVKISARGFWLVSWLATSLFLGTSGLAAEPALKPDHRIVLRVSSAMLNGMLDGKEDVNRESNIQEVIMGTSLFGRARTIGTPVVKLVESLDRATFQITFTGTSVAQTTGYNGPAIIASRSVTKFTATKLVVFEPTRGFYGQPAKVTARTQTTIQSIDSTRGGLIGRIVRRRAASIEASQHAQVEQITAQRAAQRIQLTFDKASAQRLAKLNETADVRSLASATGHPHSPMDIRYACCTTPHYFQIATSFSDSGDPMELPKYDPANPANAPVEVWVHDTFIGEPIADSIDQLAKQAETNNLVLTVSTVARMLASSDFNDKIPSILGKQPLQMHKVGRWRVAKLEMPAPDLVAVVQVLRPNSMPSGTPKKSAVAAAAHRTWTSGRYTAHARFIALEGETVKLERSSGVATRISWQKLSPVDQTWIKQHLAKAPRTASK